MSITAIRGFNDVIPPDSFVWRHIEKEAFSVFASYGFSEIKVPVVEKTELFLRSIGETTDIVEKEMYTFSDRHGDSLTLRPEGTAPVVRAYVEHKLYVSPVVKLSYTGPMFRYERPQKGRYRQFYQIGAEVLGDPSPESDAETISMLMALFSRLGITGANLNVNTLGCPGCRPAYKDALKTYLDGVQDQLCENCKRRIGANPLRALDCKGVHCIEATNNAPSIVDSVCAPCNDHFSKFKDTLRTFGVEASVNPRMVRGLDYYSRTTFEILAPGLGSQNAIAAGGRYDSLVSDLGGPETPCFGFAMGVERVALTMKEHGATPEQRPLVAFIALGDEAQKDGAAFVAGLRSRGARVVVDYSAGQMKNRMKRADRLGARFVAIMGEDELKDRRVTIKDMKDATQETLNWEEAWNKL